MILASFFLGWAPILGKLAYGGGATPYTVVSLRTVVAAAVLWALAAVFWPQEIRISLQDLIGCISVGAVNGFGSLLYYTSLSYLEASQASLLNTLYPLWVALFLFASGQALTRLTLTRLALSTFGVYLLTSMGSGEVNWLGVTLMIASAATYGWHLVLGQWVLAEISSRKASPYILTTMAAVVGVARALQGQAVEPILSTGWIAILGLGLTTALSRFTMFSALERLGGIETGITGVLELLVSLLLAFLILGERLSAIQWIGGVLLIVSLILMTRDRGMELAKGNEPLEWRTD